MIGELRTRNSFMDYLRHVASRALVNSAVAITVNNMIITPAKNNQANANPNGVKNKPKIAINVETTFNKLTKNQTPSNPGQPA